MIPRYENTEIAALWNSTAVYGRWFEVEVAHLRQVAGAAPAEALQKVGAPSQPQVAYYERRTNHDVVGFLTALDARIVKECSDPGLASSIRSALHYGLTSSDVVDTALHLGVLRSEGAIRARYRELARAMSSLIIPLTSESTVGRTHGQLAAPMPAAHRWEVLDEMLDRCWTRASQAFGRMDVGKLSGPVGASDTGDQESALAELDMRPTWSTQVIPRDRLAHWAHCLTDLVTVAEAIATQVWLLAQSGVEELLVKGEAVSGSSAMPHKVNPILAENVRGLARMARPMATELQLGMVQWGEHDLAHSSVERVLVPDLLHLTCTILQRTATLVSGVVWVEPMTPEGYVDTHEALRDLQAQGVPYVDAHAQLTTTYRTGKIADTTTEEDH